MISYRRHRYGLLAALLTLLTIWYIFTGKESTHESEFYRKTLAAVERRRSEGPLAPGSEAKHFLKGGSIRPEEPKQPIDTDPIDLEEALVLKEREIDAQLGKQQDVKSEVEAMEKGLEDEEDRSNVGKTDEDLELERQIIAARKQEQIRLKAELRDQMKHKERERQKFLTYGKVVNADWVGAAEKERTPPKVFGEDDLELAPNLDPFRDAPPVRAQSNLDRDAAPPGDPYRDAVPHAIPQAVPHAVPQAVPHAVPQAVPHAIPQAALQAAPHIAPPGDSHRDLPAETIPLEQIIEKVEHQNEKIALEQEYLVAEELEEDEPPQKQDGKPKKPEPPRLRPLRAMGPNRVDALPPPVPILVEPEPVAAVEKAAAKPPPPPDGKGQRPGIVVQEEDSADDETVDVRPPSGRKAQPVEQPVAVKRPSIPAEDDLEDELIDGNTQRRHPGVNAKKDNTRPVAARLGTDESMEDILEERTRYQAEANMDSKQEAARPAKAPAVAPIPKVARRPTNGERRLAAADSERGEIEEADEDLYDTPVAPRPVRPVRPEARKAGKPEPVAPEPRAPAPAPVKAQVQQPVNNNRGAAKAAAMATTTIAKKATTGTDTATAKATANKADSKAPATKPEAPPHKTPAEIELSKLMALSPVTIFSKSYCPHSKKAKKIFLEYYEIVPTPYVVELDKHEHGKELQRLLKELTGRATVPNIMIEGISFGGGDEAEGYWRSGELEDVVREMGGKRILRVSELQEPEL